ncbi:ATP-binding cassette domain-containing protein [Cohnella lubricantis]|uniref:ATP-binding cassette domain-containing protein n=1 Tax=Cohnella lubricantis TaxID=2163172 RepID=A0A841T905_9BACL|nr:ATP-binding cassette domain-containing protein [Cohnella lubricantis]MBB6677993.1 ATP-binding cassette domain-containing protein [Cohnella lubricantis]MBP2120545.1 energy-coupling factor transporter ATP-binding protein EcfA2/energy-coupling factor transporter transmembrane protein EcfT [Cohnella lubricantis]
MLNARGTVEMDRAAEWNRVKETNSLLVQGLSVYTELEDDTASARIENVDLCLEPGEWITIVGVNGSGKSTLARVLAGLPMDGAVGTMRRGFAGAGAAAYVMQQPDAQLFGETPREELMFALEWLETPAGEMESRALFALERAGLAPLADEPWKRLSGGQRQLAAVAAAAAAAADGRAKLIVFDEATSMLDAEAASRVMSMARELQADGAAVVWVTQRLEELTPEMRVVAMREGRVVFEGSGREFLFGREPDREEPPCVRCGLRLPYLAELALEMRKLGKLGSPLPMTGAEWQREIGAAAPASSQELGRSEVSGGGEELGGEDGSILIGSCSPDGERFALGRTALLSQRRLDQLKRITLQPGAVTVLLGANGAGKTSLLETLAGLRAPGELVVAYGDKPLWLEHGRGAGARGKLRAIDIETEKLDAGLNEREIGKESAIREENAGPNGDERLSENAKQEERPDGNAGDARLQIELRSSDAFGIARVTKSKRRLNPEAIRRYAYASQAPEEQLICRTAQQELMETLRPYRLSGEAQSERIEAALQAVGWDAERRSEDPNRMSGGERRRLALACLIAAPVPWLLIDEPTAGLDAAGQMLLAEQLRRMTASGTGVLLVSHDSEWALPLADRVLLMLPDGGIRDCTREQLLLHPRWWKEAGMEVPAWLETIHPLLRQGASLSTVWHPERLAREWTRIAAEEREDAVKGAGEEQGSAVTQAEANAPKESQTPMPMKSQTPMNSQTPMELKMPADPRLPLEPQTPKDPRSPKELHKQKEPQTQEQSDPQRNAHHMRSARQAQSELRARRRYIEADGHSALSGFDPRSVWLSYVLLSLAIFTQRGWLGLAASAIATTAAVLLGRIPLRRWRGLIAGYAIFSVLVALVAGIGAGGSIAMDAFLTALESLARTFLVTILGLGLALAVTPLRLRRSLEQLLSFRGRQPMAAQKFILTVTLMLRFIPQFLTEWNRFARYAVARSKEAKLTLRAVPRRLRATALPFLLSLLRLGEQAADALESRGVGSRRRKTVLSLQRWRKRDTALAIGALAASLALRLCG